jgi:hypothetical protein
LTPWRFLLSGSLLAAFAVQPALAGQGGSVIEVVTFRLETGIAAADFAPIDKAVEREHVAKQPGLVSRAPPTGRRRAAAAAYFAGCQRSAATSNILS